MHDVLRKKDEYRGGRRQDEKGILERSRRYVGNLRTVSAAVISEIRKQRRHDDHGEDQELRDEFIGRGVEGKHTDGQQRCDHETLEVPENGAGDIGNHDPAAKRGQWSERSPGNAEMAAKTRNGAKAKEEISECRNQPDGNQQTYDGSDAPTKGNRESRGQIEKHAGRDFDVIHQIKALRGFEDTAEGIIAEHNRHGGTEHKERDTGFPSQFGGHFEKMGDRNGNKQSGDNAANNS